MIGVIIVSSKPHSQLTRYDHQIYKNPDIRIWFIMRGENNNNNIKKTYLPLRRLNYEYSG